MPQDKQKGFTLIEIFTVFSIILILFSTIMLGFKEAIKKARDAKRKSELDQIRKAVESYYAIHGYYPDEGNCDGNLCHSRCWCWNDPSRAGSYIFKDLEKDELVNRLPTDPVNNTNFYYEYEPGCHIDGDPHYFLLRATLETTGTWHALSGGIDPNSPQCDTFD